MRYKRLLINLSAGFFILVLITLLISYFNLDLKFASHFFDQDSHKWYQRNYIAWDLAYHYGPSPAIILSVFSLLLLIVSFFVPKYSQLRRYCVFIILSLAIGPGLLVNGVFKDRWGRPRPRQVEQFGGKWQFREVWEPGIPGKGKSFPSGHSSMGFFLVVIYFVYKNKNRRIAYSGLAASLAMGFFVGTARMAQGGHFLSDVFWAGGMTFGAAAILSFFLLKIPEKTKAHERSKLKQPAFVWFASIFSALLLVYIFAFSKPVYQEYSHKIESLESEIPIHFSVQMDRGSAKIHTGSYGAPIEISTVLQGHGFTEHSLKSRLIKELKNDTLYATYKLGIHGLFQKLNVTTDVYMDINRTIIFNDDFKTIEALTNKTTSE